MAITPSMICIWVLFALGGWPFSCPLVDSNLVSVPVVVSSSVSSALLASSVSPIVVFFFFLSLFLASIRFILLSLHKIDNGIISGRFSESP